MDPTKPTVGQARPRARGAAAAPASAPESPEQSPPPAPRRRAPAAAASAPASTSASTGATRPRAAKKATTRSTAVAAPKATKRTPPPIRTAPVPPPEPEPELQPEADFDFDDWVDEVEPVAGVVDVDEPEAAPVSLTKAEVDDEDEEDDEDDEPAWEPPVKPIARRRPRTGPSDGFSSRGAAEIASVLPAGYGGKLAPPAPAGSMPPPPPPPSMGSSGASPALVGFAMVVVVLTLSALGYFLVIQQDDGDLLAATGDPTATTVAGDPAPAAAGDPGTDFNTFWSVDGYTVRDAPPEIVADARAEMGSSPFVKKFLKDIQAKEFLRGSRTMALSLAMKMDRDLAQDPGFNEGFYGEIKTSAPGGSFVTVGGQRTYYGREDDFAILVTIKADMVIMVMGETRANIEPVLFKLLANVT